jgi:hypothetical protein
MIHFDRDVRSGPASDPNRYDTMMFFADGDFRSVQQYCRDTGLGTRIPANTGVPIAGNVARIRYGLAVQPAVLGFFELPYKQVAQKRVLARQQNILTNDPYLHQWPAFIADTNTNSFLDQNPIYPPVEEQLCRERYEHDSMSLSQWQSLDIHFWNHPVLQVFIDEPPRVNLDDHTTFHKIWSQGVSDFIIQWAYRDIATNGPSVLCWFPSDDPDGIGTFPSNFASNDGFRNFGVRFNLPHYPYFFMTWPIGRVKYNDTQEFAEDFCPEALRFTFTIHDSKGIYPNGRTFTHIVYLGD